MNQVAPPIQVDRNSPVPLYFQVAQHLEHLIDSGELAAGSRLENEIDLADQLGLSRPTMRRAIQYLVDRGLLVRKRGIGTQVVHAKVRRKVELTSLYDDLSKASREPRTEVLSFDRKPATGGVALELGVPEGTEIYAFERLRYADAEPLALMRNYVPPASCRSPGRIWKGTGCTTCCGRAGSTCGSPSRPSGPGPRSPPKPGRSARPAAPPC